VDDFYRGKWKPIKAERLEIAACDEAGYELVFWHAWIKFQYVSNVLEDDMKTHKSPG
jgi:hypothetical protein